MSLSPFKVGLLVLAERETSAAWHTTSHD